MEGYLPALFMLVALKIPAIAMIWLLYWASNDEAEDGAAEESEGGGRRRRPRPLRPRGPRRGPHGGGMALPSPRRDGTVTAAVSRRKAGAGPMSEPARARENEPARR